MAFLMPALGSLASGLIGKLLHLKKGGEVHIRGPNKRKGTLAVLHDGEMVVPKKHVRATKKAMKKEHIVIPKPKSAPALPTRRKKC